MSMEAEKECYFGEPWPSGVCDNGQRVPAPTNQSCAWCKEGFVEGERGYFQGGGQAVHLECGMRTVLGSVGHLRKRCACYGGTEEDPPGLTTREAAEAAYIECQRQQRQRLITLPSHARN